MTNEQISNCIIRLGNVGIALSKVEVKGENNLNLLLASIQTVRDVKNTLKAAEAHGDTMERSDSK